MRKLNGRKIEKIGQLCSNIGSLFPILVTGLSSTGCWVNIIAITTTMNPSKMKDFLVNMHNSNPSYWSKSTILRIVENLARWMKKCSLRCIPGQHSNNLRWFYDPAN